MRPGDGATRCLVAVREQPVERLIGAAYWRMVKQRDGTEIAEFEWSMIPSVSLVEQVDFIDALVAHVREEEDSAVKIAPSAWVPPDHPLAEVLESAGFSVSGRRTKYQAEVAVWREALHRLFPFSDEGVVLSPAGEHFEELKALLCGPSLRPSELAHGFQTAHGKSPALFDPRCSAVLLVDGKITAACLANSSQSHLTLAALSGTGDQCARLLHHCLQAREGLAESTSLSFHLDDRDPPAALASLVERFPFQLRGVQQRHQLQ